MNVTRWMIVLGVTALCVFVLGAALVLPYRGPDPKDRGKIDAETARRIENWVRDYAAGVLGHNRALDHGQYDQAQHVVDSRGAEDDFGFLGPVVDSIAWKGREGVQPGAQGQHDVCLGDQLHTGL